MSRVTIRNRATARWIEGEPSMSATSSAAGKPIYSGLVFWPQARQAASESDARTARMLQLPAADERVSQLHMQAVVALIEQWEEDDADSDDYTRGQAAEDLRRVIAAACTCRALPHDRSCPRRAAPYRAPVDPPPPPHQPSA